MKRNVYALYDTRANDLVGGVQMFPSDAVAVRFFGDVASDTNQGNLIAKHLDDFELVRLATVDAELQAVIPSWEVIITGTAWKAAQAPAQGLEVVK